MKRAYVTQVAMTIGALTAALVLGQEVFEGSGGPGGSDSAGRTGGPCGSSGPGWPGGSAGCEPGGTASPAGSPQGKDRAHQNLRGIARRKPDGRIGLPVRVDLSPAELRD